MAISQEVRNRFWQKVQKTDTCWVWTASKFINGYGQFRWKSGGEQYAHRLSWRLHHKRPVPNHKFVLHRCDNPSCVRPDHLFLGTHRINMQDAARKGRMHGLPKLTVRQVTMIRTLLDAGFASKEIAPLFDVCPDTVRLIGREVTWKVSTPKVSCTPPESTNEA